MPKKDTEFIIDELDQESEIIVDKLIKNLELTISGYELAVDIGSDSSAVYKARIMELKPFMKKLNSIKKLTIRLQWYDHRPDFGHSLR